MSASHHWQLHTWQPEHARKSLLQSTLAQFRWGSAAGCPQAQGTAAGSSPEASCCPASKTNGPHVVQHGAERRASCQCGVGRGSDTQQGRQAEHLQMHWSRLRHTIRCQGDCRSALPPTIQLACASHTAMQVKCWVSHGGCTRQLATPGGGMARRSSNTNRLPTHMSPPACFR